MKTMIRPAVVLFGALTLVVGILYPLAVTGIGKLAFSDQASGSMVLRKGTPVGSSLIGQSFTSPNYFWARPSATGPMPNDARASSGSNQGPLNPALIDAVKGRIAALRQADPGNLAPVPVDLVTASASGLDPEISVAGARYQVGRVAAARKLPRERVEALVIAHTVGQTMGLFGEARVHVLKLNLALDAEPPAKLTVP